MNIIVRPQGSDLCYCRPDTTWERENRDLYSPDCVNEWTWAPVLFARVSKAGKCIGKKFVSRYYDGFNFGALLYMGGSDTAQASCIDHTSILPLPLYNPVVMDNEESIFVVQRNGEEIFRSRAVRELIEETLCKASQLTSLRIGDFVAVELEPLMLLAARKDGDISLKASYCDNEIFNFKIIL